MNAASPNLAVPNTRSIARPSFAALLIIPWPFGPGYFPPAISLVDKDNVTRRTPYVGADCSQGHVWRDRLLPRQHNNLLLECATGKITVF